MKDAQGNKQAATSIRNACYKKHNPPKPAKKEKLSKLKEYYIELERPEGSAIAVTQETLDRLTSNPSSKASKLVNQYNKVLKKWKSSGVSLRSLELTDFARSCRESNYLSCDSVPLYGYSKNAYQMWLTNNLEYSISYVKISSGICNSNNPEYTVGHKVSIPSKQSVRVVVDIPISSGSCAWVSSSSSINMTLKEIGNVLYK